MPFCAYQQTRRKVLAAALIARGIDVDVIPWSKVGLIVMRTPGNITLGAAPEYLAGHYILQVSAWKWSMMKK